MKLLLLLLVAGLTWTATTFAQPRDVVVATYNIGNYLPDVTEGPRPLRSRAKPEPAVAALVRIIKEIDPDILGLCEMGPPEQFAEFQQRLAEAGLGYTATAYVEAADAQRHLALLSRYPITSDSSQRDLRYEMNGMQEKMQRGLLDVTVRITPEYDLRLVGAHLKSKRVASQSETLMRRHEARLLRKHVEEILRGEPETNLLVFGDFNDSRNEPPIQEIMGPRGSEMHLVDLPAQDEVGDRWTHYWKLADIYSRLDYLFASPALLHEVNREATRIYRGADWNVASDHRPVFTTIRPVNLARR